MFLYWAALGRRRGHVRPFALVGLPRVRGGLLYLGALCLVSSCGSRMLHDSETFAAAAEAVVAISILSAMVALSSAQKASVAAVVFGSLAFLAPEHLVGAPAPAPAFDLFRMGLATEADGVLGVELLQHQAQKIRGRSAEGAQSWPELGAKEIRGEPRGHAPETAAAFSKHTQAHPPRLAALGALLLCESLILVLLYGLARLLRFSPQASLTELMAGREVQLVDALRESVGGCQEEKPPPPRRGVKARLIRLAVAWPRGVTLMVMMLFEGLLAVLLFGVWHFALPQQQKSGDNWLALGACHAAIVVAIAVYGAVQECVNTA